MTTFDAATPKAVENCATEKRRKTKWTSTRAMTMAQVYNVEVKRGSSNSGSKAMKLIGLQGKRAASVR